MTLLYGIAAAVLVWWLLKVFARSDTAAVAKAVKVVGGIAALGAAVILGSKGQIGMALLAGGLGAWALGWDGLPLPGPLGRFQKKTAGRYSRIRSAMIEMEIDHATGGVEGTVLAGTFAGRRLSSLDPASACPAWTCRPCGACTTSAALSTLKAFPS